jgi:hypothetical protein
MFFSISFFIFHNVVISLSFILFRLKMVIGVLQKCLVALSHLKSQSSSVKVPSDFVPLMARYKSIKEVTID